MLSTPDRRKAASLSIFLIVFLTFIRISQAMDSIPDDEIVDRVILKESVSTSNVLENSLLLKNLKQKVSENRLQETISVNFLFGYAISVNNSNVNNVSLAEECFIKNLKYEAAETEEEEKVVAVQPKEEKKKNNLRSNTKVTSKKIVSEDTASRNTISENSDSVNVQDRGKVFVYKDPVEHTEEDELYLSMIIHGEAGDQDLFEKFRVGNATLNRFVDKTGRFPQETMKGIAYANGQFGCTRGDAWLHPTEEDKLVAKELFDGKRVFQDDDIVYFNNTWIDGYFYCKPGYHCFSGYLDHNENAKELLASAKAYKPAPKTKAQEIVQEEEIIVDNSENNESQAENVFEEINNENSEPEFIEDIPNEQSEPTTE